MEVQIIDLNNLCLAPKWSLYLSRYTRLFPFIVENAYIV